MTHSRTPHRSLPGTAPRVDRSSAAPATVAARRRPRAPRRSATVGLLALLALAALPAAQARVHLDPTPAALSGGPETVGVTLASGPGGLTVRFVPAGTGTLPDATTGFAGDVPTDAVGRVDARGALGLSQSITRVGSGVVLQHEDAHLREVADAYRAALLAVGYTLESDHANGNSHTLTFAGPNGNVRVALATVQGGVQAYVGG